MTSEELFEKWFETNPEIKVRESYSEWDTTIMKGAFKAGMKAVLDGLPAKYIASYDIGTINDAFYIEGYNDCINEIREKFKEKQWDLNQ